MTSRPLVPGPGGLEHACEVRCKLVALSWGKRSDIRAILEDGVTSFAEG